MAKIGEVHLFLYIMLVVSGDQKYLNQNTQYKGKYCGSVYSGVWEGNENMNFLKEIIINFNILNILLKFMKKNFSMTFPKS